MKKEKIPATNRRRPIGNVRSFLFALLQVGRFRLDDLGSTLSQSYYYNVEINLVVQFLR